MKVLRVFPRKTNQTPDDENVRFGVPSMFDEADRINISVAFTYDLPYAETQTKGWSVVAPVEIGGPGIGMTGDEFTPGEYLKLGNVITSRGCPNKCWFCSVWKRDGEIRELQIKDGWNVQDDNLLACSDEHINGVFDMLSKQKHRAIFSGGIDTKLLKDWHIEQFTKLNPKQIFIAYDTKDDLEPFYGAVKMFKDAGMIHNSTHCIRCFVLIGYPKDTIDEAEKRLKTVIKTGVMPMAMLYRGEDGKYDKQWRRFQREWANPIILGTKF